MDRGDVAICVIFAALGPALLCFFGRNLWLAKTTGVIFGGPRYAPRLITRTEDPRAFRFAVVTHIVALVPTVVVTITCHVELFRWLRSN